MNYKNIAITYLAMGMGGATCWAFVTWSLSRLWIGFLIGCLLLTTCVVWMYWAKIKMAIVNWFKSLIK